MNTTIQPPDMRRRARDLYEYARRGTEVLSTARAEAYEGPDQRKAPRQFTLREVGDLLDMPRATLYARMRDPSWPDGEKLGNGHRVFTLAEINRMRELEGTRPSKPAGSLAKVVAFTHQKGGVGKSASAVHCAHYLVIKGYRVLLIDMDPQGSSSTMHGLIPDQDLFDAPTTFDLFTGDAKSVKQVSRPTHFDGLDLVPASSKLYKAETLIPTRERSEPDFFFYSVLDQALMDAVEDYDIILLDAPPSTMYLTLNVIWTADGIIVPVPPEYLDFATSAAYLGVFGDCMRQIENFEHEEKVYDFFRILISRFDTQSEASQSIAAWIRHTYNPDVMQNPFTITRAMSTGGAALESIYEMTPSTVDRRTYRRALDIINPVMEEIHELICAAWRNDLEHSVSETSRGES